jgi:predicted flap endonuclease-1-like 5' DNA nuclease
MPFLSKLKSILGIGGAGPEANRTSVAVDYEPSAESERAVKEPVDDNQAAPEPDPGAAVDEPVDSISGIGPAYRERLAEAGVETIGELRAADVSHLADASDIAETRLEDWIERAHDNEP